MMHCIAANFLYGNVIMQRDITVDDMLMIVDKVLLPISRKGMIDLRREKQRRYFPVKKMHAASRKANAYFSEVYADCVRYYPVVASYIQMFSGAMQYFTNDQAASHVVYSIALSGHFSIETAVEMSARAICDPAGSKALTTVLKSLGANSTIHGALLCEAQCLQGRGVGDIDLASRCRERVGESGRRMCPDLFPDSELERAIRVVVDEELDLGRYEYIDLDKFWSSRWLWSVNGAHSPALANHEPKLGVDIKGRIHRKVAFENWTVNPVVGWDGMTYVSPAAKLEHGKTRLVLACDTRNYLAFSHLFAPIEKCWRNKRTLLDPGKGGCLGIVNRVLELRGSMWLMLDYDDFNAQHTLKAQQLVIKVLCEKVGFPAKLSAPLIRSFERMLVVCEGKDIGFFSATLMSGHRGTTMLNSVLNSAYIYAACPDMWCRFSSMHTGDDVVARFSNPNDIGILLSSLRAHGVKINPMKQSVGLLCAEFLRMCITDRACRGYVTRSIASMISGNWTNDLSLGPSEQLLQSVVSSRAIANRCASALIPQVFTSSSAARSRVAREKVRRLLLGEIALGNGPIYKTTSPTVEQLHITEERVELEELSVPHNATSQYLSCHAVPVERLAFELTGASVLKPMVESSYSRTIRSATDAGRLAKLQRSTTSISVPVNGYTDVELSRLPDKKDGLLSFYPLLQFVKSKLTKDNIRQLLHYVGCESASNPELKAWGSEAKSIIVKGYFPYSEAAAACSKIGGSVLTVIRPIFM
jgi:hypothetical protein